jgi:broad specificity phosphatase PhoE
MNDRFLDLLRHGAVVGGNRFRGLDDDPLTETGWRQLRSAVDRALTAGQGAWTRILTSPAPRCADFARALGRERGLPVATVTAFGERGFGAWEGRTAAELPLADLTRFWADPAAFDPPGAEPFAEFCRRVQAAWETLRVDGPGQSLLVTHGGVIRVILGDVLGLAADRLLSIEVPHACRTRLRIPAIGGHPSLVLHG